MIAALVFLCASRAAVAQAAGTLIPIPYRTYIGINPLGVPFDIGSAEVESAVAPGITLGGLASYTDVEGHRWLTFDAKVRYYPGEVVLRGFSIGLSAGSLRYSTRDDSAGVPMRRVLTAPTIGVIADYNWMLGTERRFVVGTGLGAKRILASEDERNRVGADRAYLTARFIVGLAF
ncbi:MAG: hypothetical protein ACHQWU_08235 [Gemmatimonadales bacterium]